MCLNLQTMASENKEPNSRTPVGQLLENLGAQGIPNIKRAQNIYRKLFWIVAFIGGMFLFGGHCYMNALRYMENDFSVNHDIRYKPSLQFPAVTICNLNPVKESVLKHHFKLDEMLGPHKSSGQGNNPPKPEPMPTRMAPTMQTNTNVTSTPTMDTNRGRPTVGNSQGRPTMRPDQARPTSGNNQGRPTTGNSQGRPMGNQGRPPMGNYPGGSKKV